jgi:hypothetical protein
VTMVHCDLYTESCGTVEDSSALQKKAWRSWAIPPLRCGRLSTGDRVSPVPFLMDAAAEQLIHDGARVTRCLAFGETVPALMDAVGFRLRSTRTTALLCSGKLDYIAQAIDWFLTGCDLDVK